MTLQNLPLISKLVSKTLQLTIKSHHSYESIFEVIKNCKLISCYDEEKICTWIILDCQNMDNAQIIGKYIFETNKFTNLLVIENNHTLEIGYMFPKLPWISTIMDENLNAEDCFDELNDLTLLRQYKK